MNPPAQDLWLFGYGSLIWKADFDYAERRPAVLQGWARRFWQGSHDHRGTPNQPGRVVTLIRCANASCLGMAYRIEKENTQEVLEHLDFREKNGYERFDEHIRFAPSVSVSTAVPDTAQSLAKVKGKDAEPVSALVYVATPQNFAHLGPASDEAIAQQIHQSVGPSGTNLEYLIELHQALKQLGDEDPHVRRLVDLVQQIG